MSGPIKAQNDKRTYNKGANQDDNVEVVRLSKRELQGIGDDQLVGINNGEYIDAHNMRNTDTAGNADALVKIGGETVIYPNVDNNTFNGGTGQPVPNGADFICMLDTYVSTNKIEFWASSDFDPAIPDTFPLVRINGVIMVRSASFPIDVLHPIQHTQDDTVPGGEIYWSDNFRPPYFLNLADVIKHAVLNDPTYFGSFDASKYLLQIQKPLDIPVFVSLINVGAGGGLPVGQYQYSIRYIADTGDQSQRSMSTPNIPVVARFDFDSPQYPGVMSIGEQFGSPATAYAPQIRFRITNIQGFDSIQLIRTDYTNGIAIGTPPTSNIIKTFNLSDFNTIDVVNFIDSAVNEDILIPLTDENLNDVQGTIARVKSLRYFNQRLHLQNVGYTSLDIDYDFLTSPQGNTIYPYIEKMGQLGHQDPWNHTYRRAYPTGERFGFSITGFDTNGNAVFSVPIPQGTNFQFPNRRDQLQFETRVLSSDNSINPQFTGRGVVKAATVSGTIDQTHEVFDLMQSVIKTDSSTVIDITDNGYNPLHPTNNDTNVQGQNIVINPTVQVDGLSPSPTFRGYAPKGFAPNYYALGAAIAGLQNIDPSIQSFAITRTAPAGRVVAQGMGMYDIPFGAGVIRHSKNTNSLLFFSPDVANGFSLDYFATNPNDYQVQLVSPLGFFTEVYNGRDSDTGVDMITYARIVREDGSINIGDSAANVGLNGGDGFGYVAYAKWRNPNTITTGDFVNGAGGGAMFSLFSAELSLNTALGRQGNMYRLILANSGCYNFGALGVNAQFSDGSTQQFHEPFYIVNIIQDGKNVANQNINSYVETGNYQKITSIIGQSDGQNNSGAGYILVDERFEDCIPNGLIPDITNGDANINNGNPNYSNGHLYVYIDDSINVHAWLNVFYLDAAYVAGLKLLIDTNGFATDNNGVQIFGLYTHFSNDGRFYTVRFDVLNSGATFQYFPVNGSLIKVKYDNRFPIKFFGGTSVTQESVFAETDVNYTIEGAPIPNTSQFNIPIPYGAYTINSSIKRVVDINAKTFDAGEVILSGNVFTQLRQWIVMFACENKTHFWYNDLSTIVAATSNQFFPLINYIYRPYIANIATAPVFNHLSSGYLPDYPLEYNLWGYGGFRFLPQGNQDYADTGLSRTYNSKPQVGFTEITQFYTRDIYSLTRPINVQASPNVRTFPALNFYDISDNTGEIKYAYDANSSGKDNNLYSITEHGVCLLITDKNVLSQLSGQQLAIIGTDQNEVILGQYWVTKDIGMDYELWRGASEFNNSLYFINKLGSFRLFDNQVEDILVDSYNSILQNRVLQFASPGLVDTISSGYDVNHDEYWVQFTVGEVPVGSNAIPQDMYVYGETKKKWLGRYDYRFDKFVSHYNQMFGTRELETYLLNDGFSISGANITSSALQVSNKLVSEDKDFIRFRINSNTTPTSINVYDDKNGVVISTVPQSSLLNYNGFEAYVPRRSDNGNRVQGRFMVFEILHNLPVDFKISSTEIEFNLIK